MREVTLERKSLMDTIDKAKKIVPKQGNENPILNYVLLEVHADRAVFTATNSRTTYQSILLCETPEEFEEFSICIEIKRLKTQLRDKGTKVSLTLTGEGNGILLLRDRTNSIRLPSCPSAMFPSFSRCDPETSLKFEISNFKRASRIWNQAGGKAYFPLRGVNLQAGKIAVMDGYRLTVLRGHLSAENPINITINARLLPFLANIGKSSSIDGLYDKTHVEFRNGTEVVTTRLMECVYPLYRRIIPNAYNIRHKLTFDREAFLRTLEDNAAIFESGVVVFHVNCRRRVLIVLNTGGIVRTELPLTTNVRNDIEFAVSFGVIRDAVKLFEEKLITLKMRDNKESILIEDGDTLTVLAIAKSCQS
jgi:DNA polymerase III sliding clamp (beta) subunit (PCNA family)